jgi:hypothetical protein
MLRGSLQEDELCTNLIRFDRSKPGKSNMDSPTSPGVARCASNSGHGYSTGVVQYPKPEDAVPTRRVATLLMSFDSLDERPTYRPTRSFWICYRRKFSTWWWSVVEIFGKEKQGTGEVSSVVDEQWKRQVCAPSTAIGLPFTTSKDSDTSKRWNNASPTITIWSCRMVSRSAECRVPIRLFRYPWNPILGGERQGHISTERGMEYQQGFKDFNQRLLSSRQEGFERRLPSFCGATRPMTTPFWNRATQKTAKRCGNDEDNLSLDD